MKLSLEQTFDVVMANEGLRDDFVAEFKFDPDRKWRADRGAPKRKVLVEFEGGVWTGGRHTRGQGFIDDCEKYNAATAAGWRVFRFATNEQIVAFPKMYRQLIKSRIPVVGTINSLGKGE